MSKYIFVTGGVASSIGKGITAASLGKLLVERGLRVNVQKFSPNLNVDTDRLNPVLHGEVYVTEDGAEVDLDIGHYERFIDNNFRKNCNYTAGKIYSSIFERERREEFLGSTITLVPHVTSEIKAMMKSAGSNENDIVIVEIGGTVGDLETAVFLEAVRQFERELRPGNYIHMHCTLAPYIKSTDEVKTKPTQHSVQTLGTYGLFPDIIVARTDAGVELNGNAKKKIAGFCNLPSADCVIHNPECKNIYEVPLKFANQGIDRVVCELLNINTQPINLKKWQDMVDLYNMELPTLDIAIVGKYTEVDDSYLSIIEALKHAGLKNRYKVKVSVISSEDIEVVGAKEVLKNYDGVVIPGGFGARGTEGMIQTAKYCREQKVPFLGISFGMEIAVIDFARNVVGLKDANSTEFGATSNPVIDVMSDIKGRVEKNGVMRLGNYNCHMTDGTLARKLYGLTDTKERHRNVFEFNNAYRENFESLGMVFSGINPEKDLVEIIEYRDHPFFIGTLFHPEFKSRPNRPHPLFVGFITETIRNK